MTMNLRDVLFWDTDPAKVEFEKHAAYVIERVVRFGTLNEWRQVLNYYGEDKVEAVVINLRELDMKTMNYLSVRFNIPKEEFRCYTDQPSHLRHFPS